MPVRIHLTGRLTVAHGGHFLTTADLAGPQVALAVAVLAATHHRPMSPIELADILWVGEPPDAWRSTLRGHVSRARSALRGLGVRVAGGDGWYQIELPKGSTVDVIEAEREVHLAEAAVRDDDVSSAGRSAVVAAMITAEPVLPELTHPWVDEMRARMQSCRIRALQVLIELWLGSGHFAQAAADAERLVALDPINETGHEYLIRAHLGSGSHALALRAFERCRTVLRDELGTFPGSNISDLYEQVLHSAGPDLDGDLEGP